MRPFKEGESLQNIIQTAIPDFVEADYPLFVEFVKAYCRFVERERTLTTELVYPEYGAASNTTTQVTETYGGPAYEGRKLLEYRDVATSLDEFKDRFMAMFGKNLPRHAYIPTELLVKSLRQFYREKGTEDSVKWFFRTFLNQDAEVYFPREDVLRASDSTWRAPITLKVSTPVPDPTTGVTPANSAVPEFYAGQRIQTETGSAQVESVTTSIVGQAFNLQIIVNELTLKTGTVIGTFAPEQLLWNIDSDEVVYTTILPVISEVVISNGGSNYAAGDLVTFSEGPTGGQGYGARGEVSAVASTALNGVTVLDGGDGYVTGLPALFTSTTGSGASGYVSAVVYGDILLEDEDTYLVAEDSGSEFSPMTLEDRNTILLELTIEAIVDLVTTIQLDDADYGVSLAIPQLEGVSLDSAIEIVLAAGDEVPFMHPWVFTDVLETTTELANSQINLTLQANNALFANGAQVFMIDSYQDLSTAFASSVVTANVIVSDVNTPGQGKNNLYLKDLSGTPLVGHIFKSVTPGADLQGTITTDGTANVVGTDTNFTQVLKSNTCVQFSDGSQHIVRSVVNNSMFQTFTPTGVTLTANTLAIVPVGVVTEVTPQAQRYYGKIRTVTLLTAGDRYATPPFVTVPNISGRAQGVSYYDGDADTIEPSEGKVDVYDEAELEAVQSAGQVTRVRILDSGVNYQDANSVVITVLHGNGRTGTQAVCTPVLGALTQYPGYFASTRSFLSADKYIQDRDFYNDFTYVVKTAESFARYRDLLLKLIHPAGFKAVGHFVEEQTPEYTLPAPDESYKQFHEAVGSATGTGEATGTA